MKNGMGMGGSVISKNILNNKGRLKWCFREKEVNSLDNGWRFLSDIDIEPAVMMIFDMPVGTEFTLVEENNKKYFIDSQTGEKILR